MAEKRIDIIIGARNQVDAAFAQARLSAGNFQRSVIESNRSAAEQAFRMLNAVGKIRVAVDAAAIGVALYKGEWEKVDSLIDGLPFGIGQVAQSTRPLLEQLIDLFYGGATAAAALARANQDAADATARHLRERTNAAQSTLGEIMRSASRSMLTGLDAQLADIEARWDAILQKLREIARVSPDLAAAALAAAQQISTMIMDQAKKAVEEDAKRRKAIEDERRRDAEDLDSEIRAKSLEASKDYLGAELERLRQHYKRRIELARDAAERERLAKLLALDEQALRNRASAGQPAASRSGIGAVSVGGSFLGLQARFAGGQDPASDTAKSARQLVKSMAELVKEFKESRQRPIMLDARVVRA